MIRLENVVVWQQAVHAISNFISEGNFRFNDKGIAFRAIDPSQIVLVHFEAPQKIFAKFDVEPALVGLDVDELNKICRRAMPNDILEMELDEATLQLRLLGELERSFSLSLIDVGDEETPIPSTQFDATVEIQARLLQEALKDATLFGSSVVLKIDKDALKVEARGAQGTLNTLASGKNVKIHSKGDITSKYSLNFLENIVKEANPDETMHLELKNEAPMRISYAFGPTHIQYHLAHMIL